MKQIITVLFATGLLAALFTGCKEEYKTYSDREFVMFADTAATYMVLQDKEYFSVPVTSTVACDYDRTFGVEIIDKGSNAIEGLHYALRSNTITIKAGQRAANVEVRGLYDNIEPTDSLGFILKLVMPEQVNWNLYHDQTKVVMMKSCPYDVNDFTGWCVVTSLFLNQYPGIENTSLQRLIRTEKHPTEENMIILHDWLFSGYDVTIRLDPGVMRIGDKFLTMHTLSDLDMLPQSVATDFRYERLSTDRSDCRLSFAAPVGLLLSCNHVYNQVIFLDDHDETLKRLEASARNMNSLAGYSRSNAINREWVRYVAV